MLSLGSPSKEPSPRIQPTVCTSELQEKLTVLGIRTGDSVIFHTSLKSFGTIEGGAKCIIDSLRTLVGNGGTLMVPTFTYSDTTHFDVNASPSKTGTLTEIFRKLPEAKRSFSPTHSVAVIGARSDEYISDHLHTAPLGINSPIARLASADGWVLLLGVGHTSNSSIHVGEAVAKAPYLWAPRIPTLPREASVRLPNGREEKVVHTEMPGCSAAFGNIDAPLRQQQLVREVVIGSAHCQLIKARDVIETTAKLLHRKMDALLCNNAGCLRCVESRKRIAMRQA